MALLKLKVAKLVTHDDFTRILNAPQRRGSLSAISALHEPQKVS
jgi:hypothetical protein